MAGTKPTFAKLKLQKNTEVKVVKVNELEIEVKQYLPVEDKLKLISNVINYSADENNFANPVKVDVFGTLEIIYAYTNLGFTEKQKEDPANLYDLLISSGVADELINAIPEMEYSSLINSINECSTAIYAYRNSVAGIIENVLADYNTLDLNATDIQKKLADPENLGLLREILTKMG